MGTKVKKVPIDYAAELVRWFNKMACDCGVNR